MYKTYFSKTGAKISSVASKTGNPILFLLVFMHFSTLPPVSGVLLAVMIEQVLKCLSWCTDSEEEVSAWAACELCSFASWKRGACISKCRAVPPEHKALPESSGQVEPKGIQMHQ